MAAQASSNTTATSTGFWDLDEPLPAVSRRLRRAGAVGGVWVLSALPVAFGWQRCPIATLLHRPCPGCGMTRAIRLLASGELGASLRMHPLAGSTVWTTYAAGSPVRVFRTRFGRLALGLAAVVYGALVVLWILRAVGYFGGPVPG